YWGRPAVGRVAIEPQVDPGRLGIGFLSAHDGVEIHPECVAATESTARLLATLGHNVEAARPDALFRNRRPPIPVCPWSASATWCVSSHGCSAERSRPTTRGR